MTTEQANLTFQHTVHFKQARHGRKRMTMGEAPTPVPKPVGRVPRIARIMALAIRFEKLVSQGEVRDYADLARLGHVSRARVTQIMNLLSLAPDIQEALLFLPPVESGRDLIKEWQVRRIAAEPDWRVQRRIPNDLQARAQYMANILDAGLDGGWMWDAESLIKYDWQAMRQFGDRQKLEQIIQGKWPAPNKHQTKKIHDLVVGRYNPWHSY